MRSLLKLIPYLRPFSWLIFLSALLAIPLSLLRLGPAPLIRYLFDHLLIEKNPSKLILFPFILIGLYGLNFIVRFAHYYLLRIVIIRVNQKLKNRLFNHLLGLSADYFTHQSTGTLISRISSDPNYIDIGLSCINVIVREPLTLLFLFIYAMKINWRLTLMTLLIAPVIAWIFANTGKNLKRYLSQMTTVNAQLYSMLQESFVGIRMIKIFGLEGYIYTKFHKKTEHFSKLLLKTSLIEEAAHPMIELLTAIALSPIIYYGGLQVIHAQLTPGELFSFFAAFGMMMNPIRMMNDINMKIHQASAACERVFEVFDWKSNLTEVENPLPLKKLKNEIQFEKVSFAYPDAPKRFVLKEINFTIPKGNCVAIVGTSGSGKSSLVNLTTRLFDVTSGCISIDGQDIRSLQLQDLRQMITVVSQDIFLFDDTIEENIRCGKLLATYDEIQKAAEKAHALEFINHIPNGFKTQVGERGLKLSGGERQRISIARAFLSEAPILILDEATSSLDKGSEKIIQAALEELMKDKTTLIIAHRLSTIRQANQIIVLKEGKIIEQGQHHELLEKRGEYARFYELGG